MDTKRRGRTSARTQGQRRLKIEVWDAAPGIGVVCLKGIASKWDIDVLTGAIEGLFARSIHRIVLDLSKTELVASGVFGAFLSFADQAARNGGRLVFASAPDIIRVVLNRLGILDIFSFASDVDSAVKELAIPDSR